MPKIFAGILLFILLVLTPAQLVLAADCEDYTLREPYSIPNFLTDAMVYFSISSRDNFAYVCFRDGDPLFSTTKFACLELGPNLSSPVITRSLMSLPTSSNCMVLMGDHALMAMGSSGIGVVDVSNPDLLPGLSLVPTGDVCRSLALLEPDHVVTAEWSALRIYGLADPADPQVLGAVPLSQARAVAIGGDFAFVACGNLGLAVVDVSNPAAPALVVQYPVGGFVDQVAVVGSQVYLTGYLIGMVTVDVTIPAGPSVVHVLPLEGEPEAILTQGGYAYILVEEAIPVTEGLPDFDAMVLVQLNQTSTPALVDYFFVTLNYSALAYGSDRIFLGEGEGTADLIQAPVQCPDLSDIPETPVAGISLAPPWPNPFNPLVNIRLKISTGESGQLKVYDLRGNLVDEIWRGTGTGNEVTVTWNGTDHAGRACPSGNYRFVLSGGKDGLYAQTSGTLLR